MAHPLTELANAISESLKNNNIKLDYKRVASCLRYYHQRYRNYTEGSYSCSDLDVELKLRIWLKKAITIWYDSLFRFYRDNGLTEYQSHFILDRVMDIHLHEAQVESRKEIVEKAKKHATKGGILETAMNNYSTQLEPLIFNIFSKYPNELYDTSSFIDYGNTIRNLANIAREHANLLSKKD